MKETLIMILILFSINIYSKEKYICGIATGYPPYQFVDSNNRTTGFDALITRELFRRLDKKVVFLQDDWEVILRKLYYTEEIDFVCGMEINNRRKRFYLFTIPYYKRKSVIFVLKDNKNIKNLNDLINEKIIGDRDSYVEEKLKKLNLYSQIRIKRTYTKEESFKIFSNGEYSAVIAPKAVGLYFTKKNNLKVRILDETDKGSEVAFAFNLKNIKLRNIINKELEKMIQENLIEKIYNTYLFED